MRKKTIPFETQKGVIKEHIEKDDTHLILKRVQFLDKGVECVDRFQIRHNGKITHFSPNQKFIESVYQTLIGE